MDFSRPPRLHTQFSSSPTEPTMLTDAHFAQRNGVKAPHTHSSTTHAVHRSRPQSPKDPIVANGDHGGRRSIAHGVSSAPSASVISAKKELSTSPIEISAFSDDEHDDFYDYHDSDRKKSGVRNLLSKISHWRGTEKAVCGKLLHYDSLLKAKSISDGLIISWFMDPSPNDASKSVSLKLLRAIEQEAVEGFQTWLLLGSKRRKLFDESCKAMTLYSEETRISFVLVIYKFIWANIKKALEYAKVNKHQLSQKDLAVVLYLLSRMDAGEDLSPHTQRRVGEQKSAFSPAILLGILQETGEFLVSNTFKSCIASCLPESDQTALIYYLSSTARISSPAYCPSDADVRVLSCESCSISKFWTTSFTSGAGKFRLVDVGSPDCHSFQLLGKIRKAAKIMLFYVDLMDYSRFTHRKNNLETLFETFDDLCWNVKKMGETTPNQSSEPQVDSPVISPIGAAADIKSVGKYHTLPTIIIIIDSVEKASCYLSSMPFSHSFPDYRSQREDIQSVISYVEGRFLMISKRDSLFRNVKHEVRFLLTSDLLVSSPLYTGMSEDQLLFESLRGEIVDLSRSIA